jgi:hypothetical protein
MGACVSAMKGSRWNRPCGTPCPKKCNCATDMPPTNECRNGLEQPHVPQPPQPLPHKPGSHPPLHTCTPPAWGTTHRVRGPAACTGLHALRGCIAHREQLRTSCVRTQQDICCPTSSTPRWCACYAHVLTANPNRSSPLPPLSAGHLLQPRTAVLSKPAITRPGLQHHKGGFTFCRGWGRGGTTSDPDGIWGQGSDTFSMGWSTGITTRTCVLAHDRAAHSLRPVRRPYPTMHPSRTDHHRHTHIHVQETPNGGQGLGVTANMHNTAQLAHPRRPPAAPGKRGTLSWQGLHKTTILRHFVNSTAPPNRGKGGRGICVGVQRQCQRTSACSTG